MLIAAQVVQTTNPPPPFRPLSRPPVPRCRLVYSPLDSFPIGLPLSWLGFGGRPTQEIPASSEDAPWSADLDHEVLGPFFSKDGSGGYGETAFFHKVGSRMGKLYPNPATPRRGVYSRRQACHTGMARFLVLTPADNVPCPIYRGLRRYLVLCPPSHRRGYNNTPGLTRAIPFLGEIVRPHARSCIGSSRFVF